MGEQTEIIITCIKESETKFKSVFIARVLSLAPEVDSFSLTSNSFLRKVHSA